MNEFDEIPQAIEIMRGVIAEFEFRALAGNDPPDKILDTIKAIVSVAMSHGEAPRGRGAPIRGLGYDFDEAQIVASLNEYGGSLDRAVRAHYQRDDNEWLEEGQIETIVRRIRGRKKEIDAVGIPDYIGAPPAINSGN